MKILKALLSVVITLVVIVGGFMLYVNARYGINVVSVIKSLDKLSANVDVATIAPNAVTDADYATTKTQLNSSLDNLILFDSETATYSINTSLSATLTGDMKLTGKNACVLLNLMLNSNDEGISATIGGKEVNLKEYDFKVVQVDFAELDGNFVNFNVTMSVSLTKIKDKMTGFVLSLLKNKVPNKLYISSTLKVEKKTGTFSYENTHVSLALNNMTGKEVENLAKLVNIVAKIGSVDQFNLTLGSSFVNALIGNAETPGFAYSLTSAGATDFAFEKQGDVVYFVIKN